MLGSTFDGSYEPVQAVCAALDQLQSRDGVNVPVHVDAASGGLVAPFLDPQLMWDFRLPRVVSINTSGHKYSLTTPGLGWLVWRDPGVVPAELGFEVDCINDLRVLAAGDNLPVVAFTTRDHAAFTVTDVAERLRQRGWLVPTYTLPANRTDLTIARLVCRNDLSDILARRLANDVTDTVTALTTTTAACAGPAHSASTDAHHDRPPQCRKT